MTWTKGHDVLLCREVLVVQPFQFKHGTHDRGQSWEKIAANLNLVERPLFTVDQRAVRDRFTKLEKDYRRKKNEEERASGIAPDEPDELDQALEDIIEMSEWQKEQPARGNIKKKNEVEKEKKTAEAVRKRAMERMGETRERENEERSAKKRKSGTDAVEYLKEKREEDGKMKEEDLELRKREFELKVKLKEEEMKMKRKDQAMRERERAAYEGERIGREAKEGPGHYIYFKEPVRAATGYFGRGTAAKQVASVPLSKKSRKNLD